MKKIFITVLLLLGMSVNAASIRLAPNLYYVKKVVTQDAIVSCFAYFNVEKAKLNGRVFELEYTCVYDYGGESETGDTYFYYGTNEDFVKGKPYYFRRPQILDTIMRYQED